MARLGVWSGRGPQLDLHQPTFDLDERALAVGRPRVGEHRRTGRRVLGWSRWSRRAGGTSPCHRERPCLYTTRRSLTCHFAPSRSPWMGVHSSTLIHRPPPSGSTASPRWRRRSRHACRARNDFSTTRRCRDQWPDSPPYIKAHVSSENSKTVRWKDLVRGSTAAVSPTTHAFTGPGSLVPAPRCQYALGLPPHCTASTPKSRRIYMCSIRRAASCDQADGLVVHRRDGAPLVWSMGVGRRRRHGPLSRSRAACGVHARWRRSTRRCAAAHAAAPILARRYRAGRATRHRRGPRTDAAGRSCGRSRRWKAKRDWQ